MALSYYQLTAIVPVRNMEGKLGLLEHWLQDASAYSLQVRIILDESSDNTEIQLVETIKKIKNVNVSVTKGKFGSPGAARNAGMKNLNSTWVTFWDSDDYPNLKNVFEVLNTPMLPSDLLVGNFKTLEFSNTYSPVHIESKGTRIPTLKSIIESPGIWRWLIKVDLIGKSEFPPLGMAEDQCLLAELLTKKPAVLRFPIDFYCYSVGRHDSQTGSKKFLKDLIPAITFIKESRKKATSFGTKLILSTVILRLQLSRFKAIL